MDDETPLEEDEMTNFATFRRDTQKCLLPLNVYGNIVQSIGSSNEFDNTLNDGFVIVEKKCLKKLFLKYAAVVRCLIEETKA